MRKMFALFLVLALLCAAAAALAETWTCVECGRESEGNFCSWCGAGRPAATVTCPACGAEFDAGAGFAFCNNCGASLSAPVDSPVDSPAAPPAEFPAGLEAGSVVIFGAWEQDGDKDNGPEPIEWIAIDARDGKLLIISRYGLDVAPYHTENADVTWEECSLRAWLNGDFLAGAFSAEEQNAILTTYVDNSDAQKNSDCAASGGNDTQDRVFLLSYAEAGRYFGALYWGIPGSGDNFASRLVATPSAVALGAYPSETDLTEDGEPAVWWWLRSPGETQNLAAVVSSDGTVDYYVVYDASGCVRPAMWVEPEAVAD